MRVLGLMSGTSVDGVDLALCEINGVPPQLEATMVAAETYPYEARVRQAVLDACQPETGRVDVLSELNFTLGACFSHFIADFLHAHQQPPPDLIASHGQTVWHNVDPSGAVTSTLQIGSAAVLAEQTGVTVVNNFRERDVAAGGQGAPLTAYVDWLLLRHPHQWRAVQNIGGMGNVSFLPPLSDDTRPMTGFDTGPGNVLIDAAVTLLTDGAQTYDHDGQLAAAGQIDGAWLEELLDHPYYRRQPPKTTGRELFGTAMAAELVTAVGRSAADIVATLSALTAYSIAQAYHDFAPAPPEEIIIGGGGARNPVVMGLLRRLVAPVPVLTHEEIGINSDHKEALVFAVLAYETWHHRPATLPTQTGARRATVLGQITPGANYTDLIRQTWSSR